MSLRLAIFDCDGTLVDGQAAVCDAMEEAFAAARLAPPDRNAVRRIVGLSLPHAIRSLAPGIEDSALALAVESYKRAFRRGREEGRVEEPLFGGMRDVLHHLSGAGWLLGVATGKSDRGLCACLDLHEISQLFVTLQTADRHPSKPHPAMLEAALGEAGAEPRHTVMIGDTTFDIEMARNAGIRAIGVAWGYHEPDELLAAGASAIAAHPDQLKELLDG